MEGFQRGGVLIRLAQPAPHFIQRHGGEAGRRFGIQKLCIPREGFIALKLSPQGTPFLPLAGGQILEVQRRRSGQKLPCRRRAQPPGSVYHELKCELVGGGQFRPKPWGEILRDSLRALRRIVLHQQPILAQRQKCKDRKHHHGQDNQHGLAQKRLSVSIGLHAGNMPAPIV